MDIVKFLFYNFIISIFAIAIVLLYDYITGGSGFICGDLYVM